MFYWTRQFIKQLMCKGEGLKGEHCKDENNNF
uniref:Uncharacterized protein n=1 Tax=Arundo donax TaxID=35708 RepID=A0A0A8Z8A6_ARUDO